MFKSIEVRSFVFNYLYSNRKGEGGKEERKDSLPETTGLASDDTPFEGFVRHTLGRQKNMNLRNKCKYGTNMW